ncbi:MAG: hypothetical protein ABJI62_03380, partial [Alphaproteobacteria bacterium]
MIYDRLKTDGAQQRADPKEPARVVNGTAQLGATRPGRAEAIWFYLAVERIQNPVRVIAMGDPKDAFSC